MSGRLYRVVERLPWIEGGRPTPEGWEGGKDVVYEPGDTAYIDDQGVASIYHHLEAMDETGRALLEEARAKAEGPAQRTSVADFTPRDIEILTGALDEKRRLYGCVGEYANRLDGSRVLLRYVPTNPLPGVVYGDNGLPQPWTTATQRERREMEDQLTRIRRGASLGGRRGRETKRDKAARSNEALLADVRKYRAEHPSHGGPAIAKALVDKHGRKDHADPRGRERAIEALRKRIARLEGSLDK